MYYTSFEDSKALLEANPKAKECRVDETPDPSLEREGPPMRNLNEKREMGNGNYNYNYYNYYSRSQDLNPHATCPSLPPMISGSAVLFVKGCSFSACGRSIDVRWLQG